MDNRDENIVRLERSNKSAQNEPQKKSPRLHFFRFSDAKLGESQKTLVQGLLTEIGFTLAIGEPGCGKTFLALDLAAHIAAGAEWFGRKTQKGAVFYVAAEAGQSISARILALKIRYPEFSDIPLLLVPCSVDLFSSQNDVEEILGLIQQHEACGGEKVRLVVIDTLNRALAGGDENSSQDMGKFIKCVDRIRDEGKVHVLVVHHAGKDLARGARGHSSLKAAVDTEIVVSNGTIKASKQRDLPLGEAIAFKLQSVSVGVGADGEQITSCAVYPGRSDDLKPKLKERSLQALEVLRALSKELGPPVVVKAWKSRFADIHCVGLSPAARGMAFNRAAEELSVAGLVRVSEGVAWLGSHTLNLTSQEINK